MIENIERGHALIHEISNSRKLTDSIDRSAVSRLAITQADLNTLSALQAQKRKDSWKFVFTIDTSGALYPFERFGFTPLNERSDYRGTFQALEDIAEIALEKRGPGRFFLNQTGVFYKDRASHVHQLIEFESE